MDARADTRNSSTMAATATRGHVGSPRVRVEDQAILTGRGQYGDDAPMRPGTLHAAIVRSPHAHARVTRVDGDRAMAVPGVRAVLTPRDVAGWSRRFVVGVKQPMEQWAVAMDKVRYVGEPVAVVIAESRYAAEDGAPTWWTWTTSRCPPWYRSRMRSPPRRPCCTSR